MCSNVSNRAAVEPTGMAMLAPMLRRGPDDPPLGRGAGWVAPIIPPFAVPAADDARAGTAPAKRLKV
jgi:hypothetical protein